MKSFLLFLVATIGFSQYSLATIFCSGQNSKKALVVLKVEPTGDSDSRGFRLANVSRIVMGASNPIDRHRLIERKLDGCMEAVLTGIKNGEMTTDLTGDLYLECDGDGDAGFMELKSQKNGKFQGRFVAPNGNFALGLADEEEVYLTCNSK